RESGIGLSALRRRFFVVVGKAVGRLPALVETPPRRAESEPARNQVLHVGAGERCIQRVCPTVTARGKLEAGGQALNEALDLRLRGEAQAGAHEIDVAPAD